MSGDTGRVTVGATGVELILPDAPAGALEMAKQVAESSKRRVDIPVRKAFVKAGEDGAPPPLARLVARKGRGGAVAVKLYLALIWRCSKAPFETQISARKWATLLGLNEPNTLGARRITSALEILADENLVRLHKHRGDATLIELLEESGSGRGYTLPSTAHTLAGAKDKSQHVYFKVPQALWTAGHVQSMSSSALAMLLVTLSDQRPGKVGVWWSTSRFPAQFHLTPTTRSKGTKELVGRRLLYVSKQAVASAATRTFARERVRNLYLLINEAYPHASADAATQTKTTPTVRKPKTTDKTPAPDPASSADPTLKPRRTVTVRRTRAKA